MREVSVDLIKNDKEKVKKIEQAKNKLLIYQITEQKSITEIVTGCTQHGSSLYAYGLTNNYVMLPTEEVRSMLYKIKA